MSKRILLVDDEESICESLSMLLSREGYTVVASSDGSRAIEEAGKKPFDVLITDVLMPGIDGISLLKTIKKMNPDIAVVMMTGHGDIDSYLESMNLGAFEYLMKPINFSELKSILKMLTA